MSMLAAIGIAGLYLAYLWFLESHGFDVWLNERGWWGRPLGGCVYCSSFWFGLVSGLLVGDGIVYALFYAGFTHLVARFYYAIVE